ncbi:SDR family NAD(P)-dependent oxidoreductase [Novosphingobium sp. KN65.2]|uniref:SDR family NAD(P)-dependent oxidoreductase n=1 Tax=Novosphingobium sp. KN65.2 TaxID=1478134 RepID=UPI0005E000FB|nr:SDR family NAD(P)-dependent oxidoreductase [Novosphingobium sp. KN65.2]CDO34412.1 putative oxidoreductase [Novosphingobium sp. KN65.2]
MTKPFGFKSTTDDVLAEIDVTGKRILVTGVSAGLGLETTRALASHGAQVVGTARDRDKASKALAEAGLDRSSIELVELDLADLGSVRSAADRLRMGRRPLDLVIANAGVMAPPPGLTADGFETQFGTNHLGHFAFVNRIAALMRPGSRLVMLASSGHRFSDVDLMDPNFDKTPYDPFIAYGRSKTANILFAVEFDRRYRALGLRATAVHPGGIQTELARHMGAERLQLLVDSINADLAKEGKPKMEWKTPQQGAATTLWAGLVADADDVGGRYCEDCQVSPVVSDESIGFASPGVRPYALDPETAKALWAKSEDWVSETFDLRLEATPVDARARRDPQESRRNIPG